MEIYRKAGYPTAVVNNLTGEGLETASLLLRGGITAFCGNSGAGKSSLMNGLYPDLKLATGEISKKLGRGRHTTRHVELFPDGHGGWLCDTPGFSALEFTRQRADARCRAGGVLPRNGAVSRPLPLHRLQPPHRAGLRRAGGGTGRG